MTKRFDEYGNPNRRDCTCKNPECKQKNGKVIWEIDWEDNDRIRCPKCQLLHCPCCLRLMFEKGKDFTSSSGSGDMGSWYTMTCLHCGFDVQDSEW